MSKNELTVRTFDSKVKVRFRDADPAGILFFGNILGMAHDVFEDFLKANNVPWDDWFANKAWACPIRHTEVDYQHPFLPGQEYSIQAKVEKLGDSSFCMHYEFRNPEGQLCSRVQMIHVFVDKKSFAKITIPSAYRVILENYSRS